MWVGEMGVWYSWPGQQGDTLVMRWGWGQLSNRGQEGDTLVMRWGWGHLSNRGQEWDTLVMRWGWGHLSNRGQEGDILVMSWGWGHLSNRGQEGDTLVIYTSPEHYHCQSISTPSSHSITLTRTLSSCTEHYQIWTEHLQTIVFCRALSNDSVLSKPDSVLCKPESVLVQLDRVLAW